jgi:hypothetical protein
MLRRLIALALAGGVLAGCQHSPPTFVAVGAPLVVYSLDFQDKAAAEFAECRTKYPHLTTLIIDYGKLREATRKITGQDTKPPLTDGMSESSIGPVELTNRE